MNDEAPLPPWLRLLEADAALPDAAVAIAPGAEHIGVVYRREDGTLRWLHLAFHHRLRDDAALPADHRWVLSPLDPERLTLVAAMCERVVARVGRNMPYGFRYDATRFAADGVLLLGDDEVGLTCATFVLALFRSVGVELLRVAEWTARPDDTARHAALVALLEAHCEDKAHVRAVRKEAGCVRFRPAKVAGASSERPPCGFARAEETAEAIVRGMGAAHAATMA